MNDTHAGDERSFRYLMAAFASIRVASGISQQALANLAGITLADVERIESGSAGVHISTIHCYTRALGGKITFEIGEPDGLH